MPERSTLDMFADARNGLSRRNFLRGAAGAAGLAVAGGVLAACGGSSSGSGSSAAAASGFEDVEGFTIATWGGTSEAGFLKAWGGPFTKKTGVAVTPAALDYGKFKTQQQTGKLQWDWFDAEAFFPYGNEALFDDLDYDYIGVKQSDLIEVPGVADFYRPKALVNYLTSWVTGYRTDAEKHPRNWEEFFDVKAVPGKRSIYNYPYGMLEIALLGDGVPADKLYPLDVDRALAKYDSIREDLVFWNSAAESQQQLVNKGADFVVTWNNRIGYLGQTGQPVAIEWQDNLRTYGSHILPHDARSARATLEWIKTGCDPQNQAELALAAGFAPTLKSALPLVSDDIAPWLSTSEEALQKSIGGMDESWWGANMNDVSTKWYEWAGS
ncbi:MAG: extracellular solute-binding protein [Modestobacter sp.]|jgi:putative spermidine/putrescine transport system substrate-binding protein|nr:extracellular solute-binding protein [Modestobacter sp.]